MLFPRNNAPEQMQNSLSSILPHFSTLLCDLGVGKCQPVRGKNALQAGAVVFLFFLASALLFLKAPPGTSWPCLIDFIRKTVIGGRGLWVGRA